MGILGAFSGKVGNVVGVVMKNGQFYVRSKPKMYRDRKSASQLQQRGKLGVLMHFESLAKDFINDNLLNYAVGKSQTNVATSMNMKTAVFADDAGANVWIEYDKIRLSTGQTAGVAQPMALRNGNEMVLAWLDNAGLYNARVGDMLQVLVYDETRDKMLHVRDVACRGDLSTRIALPEGWNDDALHVYATFMGKGEESSETGYAFVPAVVERGSDAEIRDIDNVAASMGTADGVGSAGSKVLLKPYLGTTCSPLGKEAEWPKRPI